MSRSPQLTRVGYASDGPKEHASCCNGISALMALAYFSGTVAMKGRNAIFSRCAVLLGELATHRTDRGPAVRQADTGAAHEIFTSPIAHVRSKIGPQQHEQATAILAANCFGIVTPGPREYFFVRFDVRRDACHRAVILSW